MLFSIFSTYSRSAEKKKGKKEVVANADLEALPLLGVVHGDLRHVGHGLLDLVAELPVLALQRLLPLLVVLDLWVLPVACREGIPSREAANFTGLVLGCIEPKFCKKICV